MAENLEELSAYHLQVKIELDRRIERISRINSELAANDFRLKALDSSGRTLVGDTARILAQVSYRAKLKRDRVRHESELAEATEDMKRAEDRLSQVEAEIESAEVAAEMDVAPEIGANDKETQGED